MCDSPPMIMFCGLPVSVAVEPMLAARASPIRCGRGSRRNRRARCKTSGVRARQTTSLTSSADSTAESPIVAASRPSGQLSARPGATPARRSKKPARGGGRRPPPSCPAARQWWRSRWPRRRRRSSERRWRVPRRAPTQSNAGAVDSQSRQFTEGQPGIGEREPGQGQPESPGIVHGSIPLLRPACRVSK